MSEYVVNFNGLVSESEAAVDAVQRRIDAIVLPRDAGVRLLESKRACPRCEQLSCVCVSLSREQIAALEAEARAVLAIVEPRHTNLQRGYYRSDIFVGHVQLEHGVGSKARPIVPLSQWRPRATRTRGGGYALAGGWLDDPVPPLSTTVRTALPPERVERARREEVGHAIGELLGPHLACWSEVMTEGLRVSSRSSWHRSRAEARDYPAERGWCTGLGASEEQAKRGTAAGWRLLCGVLRNVMRETDAQWAAERAVMRAEVE